MVGPIVEILEITRLVARESGMKSHLARIDLIPVAMANLDVGHGGTYREPNGGEFGRVRRRLG